LSAGRRQRNEPMMSTLKDLLKRTPLYPALTALRQRRELADWERRGRPAPPPHVVKQRTLRTLAQRFGLNILVETGTFYGDMVDAMQDDFDRIYSIELSPELAARAQRRFAGHERIAIIQGDSGHELGKIMGRLDQSTLFWLDGHYSAGETAKGDKDTPIFEELTHIFGSPERGHVVVIDDARCFGSDPDYPSLEQLSTFIRSHRPACRIEVADDSIRILPDG